ncbi:lipase [Aspergillus aurantiobrunneus]
MRLQTLISLALTSLSLSPSLASDINDFSCRSTTHPNPIILLHGLGTTQYNDIHLLQTWLQDRGYCTYAMTYGCYDLNAVAGGMKPIAESAPEIASYIREVKARTGADKIDIVGHSEGGFQALYVPKFEAGIAEIVERVVAIGPPTRGTDAKGLYYAAYVLGDLSREVIGEVLRTVGCGACDDVGPGGRAVERLNDGRPIVQSGNRVTVIASRFDELVTPADTAFVYEDGVRNVWVQDVCPRDMVGHMMQGYDENVCNLVKNALDDEPDREFDCVIGPPLG